MSAHPKSAQPKVAPVIKNVASAPIIYFDNAPTYGVMANVVEIDLAAAVLALFPGNEVKREPLCVGHLRCSIDAALALRAALDGALKMAHALPAENADTSDDVDEPSPGAAFARRMEASRNN